MGVKRLAIPPCLGFIYMKTNKQTVYPRLCAGMPAIEDSNGTWWRAMGYADGLYLGHKYHESMVDRTTGTDYHWYKVGYDAGVVEFCFAEGDE